MRAWCLIGCWLAAGCTGSFSADGDPAAEDEGPACSRHAECDDGDPCTEELCDVAAGVCRTSRLDACAAPTPIIDEDFESRPGQPVDDRALFEGDWWAERAPGCPVGLDVAVEEPFDSFKEGPLLHGDRGWAVAKTGGAAVSVVADPDGAGVAMDVRATTSTGSYAQAAHPITAQARGSVELRFRPAGPTKAKWIGLNEGDDSRILVHFDADGVIRYRDGGSKIALGPYQGDRWYTIRIDWDAATDRTDISIDGVEHPDLGTNQPIDEFIDRVRFRTATGTGLSFMVDDVVVTGGDGVHPDGEASLRAGAPGAPCDEPATAARAIPALLAGGVELDVMARGRDQAHTIVLAPAGDPDAGGLALSLDRDGQVRWQVNDQWVDLTVATAWSEGTWHRIALRWDAATESADLWFDGELVAVGLRPRQPMTALPDQLRATAGAGGALWVDNLRVLDTAAAD
ncbi:MAG TPA: LamG-like jellyroll fold domain-containing protein [Kofleriaceae bacterium]|nr:LamG-like jellyroll fold domain-containing protein [Kofleriaceae bacterium]